MEMPLWISESDVVQLMDMRSAMTALESGLRSEAAGHALNMVKTHVEWSQGGTLHAIGAAFPEAGFVGTKTWAHTTGGATPLVILYDSNNGELKAVIESFALGQMRTASVSALATERLAPANVEELAIIGTGKQAIAQVAAILAVRPIRQVRAFSPDQGRRNEFVARVEREFEIPGVAASSVREAVQGAAIVTAVSRAKDPIITADMLEAGSHLNAVGAITPTRAEFASDVIARATQIIADSVPQAQRLSRELIEAFGVDPAKWQRVQSLAKLIAGTGARNPGDDLTFFKSLGMGISDLALAIDIYRKAAAACLGRKFPHPEKVLPKLQATQPAPSHRGG